MTTPDGQYGAFAHSYGPPPGQPPFPPQYPPPPSYGPMPGQPMPGQYGPSYYPIGYPYGPPPATNGVGTAGFVLGVVGLFLFWFPGVGLLLGLLGCVLGGAGISAGRQKRVGTGLAVAGLVCGILATVAGLLLIIGIATS